ncbi:2TM domain-containing protein [Gelidibacter salicanalis]|uniref:2TM domain-containing protein n=1 Tax=Gelidibacter salicanalis TaxID=291193 RepID=A0A934KL80_9FLAO|nr:2TM domain-containing protein [Gelidibacter salicanalis]MBJ7881197.1 2TM domain-containing protein [Gelidibacter salicanalis]
MKNILLTFFIGCAVFVAGNVLNNGFQFESFNEFLEIFSFYQLYSFLLGYSNYYYFAYLEKLTWTREERFKRIAIGIIGSVVITMIGLVILNGLQYVIYHGSSVSDFLQAQRWNNYSFGLWITLTIVIIFHVVYFYNRYQQNKIKEQKVIANTASAQFESLKNQIDPHFLFNSLNVLTSLIEENPGNAQRFTVSLSKIYRYVLEQKDKELVTVAEELEFAKIYMNLLKMRFENSINFEIPEDFNKEEAKVVPLSLQLLLENTIKHNTVSESKPLHISITVEDNYLVVKNNLQKKEVLQQRKGVGLQNIVNRYGILTKRPVLIDESAAFFKVKIPILTKQTLIMKTKYLYNEQEAYHRAKKRVEDLKGFFGNLVSYCVVIPFLIFINYKTSWNYQWFWFPMLGWGMGIIFHAFGVFGYGKEWEERKIKEILEKEQNTKTWN